MESSSNLVDQSSSNVARAPGLSSSEEHLQDELIQEQKQ